MGNRGTVGSDGDCLARVAEVNETRQQDSLICAYRWAVLGSHAVVLLYFLDTDILNVLAKNVEPFCWPYFQQCWQLRFEASSSTTVLLLVQACLIAVATVAVAAKHFRVFWVTMVLLNVYLFAIISLDYRFRANEFYMLLWLNAVFLFWPAKRWTIPLILVSFYLWAGVLKLNYEWLSGAVLYHPLFLVPPRFEWVACTYVVGLEMIAIWGLLAKRAWIRWLTLGQLVLFHIESLSQIHWFYPLLMVALLSWFVIYWTALQNPPAVSLANLCRGQAPRSAYLLLATFASCQLAPYLYHGDKALSGQGRILALHMFEARQVCDVHALIHHKNHTTYDVDLLLPGLAPRMICDPVVYFDRVSNLCRLREADPNFTDVDFVMRARRTTDATMTTIVNEANFCSRHEVYSIFSNNRWMR